MIGKSLFALVEGIRSCRCWRFPEKVTEEKKLKISKLTTEVKCKIIKYSLYLPMFFILIFASGGISSGSLYMTKEN